MSHALPDRSPHPFVCPVVVADPAGPESLPAVESRRSSQRPEDSSDPHAAVRRSCHRHLIPGGVRNSACLGAKAGEIVWSARVDIAHLIPAAALVFLVGLSDDIWGLKAAPKLIGETAAAVCAYFAGVHVSGLGGVPLAHWLSLPVTVFWLLACTNAVNLIDGLDGLAAGLGLFATATAVVVALMQHNIGLALAVVPLLGALLGFLRYNFSPATIFLGDSGSLFIGFLLGCYGVLWSQKSVTLLGMTAPLMVLAIPLLDTSLAIARRFLNNRPIFSADRGHIHHRLLDRGFAPRKVVLLLYGCCAAGALCSLGMMNSHSAEAVLIVFCAFVWAGIHHLGYLEFNLVRRLFRPRSFRAVVQSLVCDSRLSRTRSPKPTPVDECWAEVRKASQDLGFCHLVMRLDHTFYEEKFSDKAIWQTWTVRVPLSATEFVNISHSSTTQSRPW